MARHTHTQASSHGVEMQDATRVSKQMIPSRLGRKEGDLAEMCSESAFQSPKTGRTAMV